MLMWKEEKNLKGTVVKYSEFMKVKNEESRKTTENAIDVKNEDTNPKQKRNVLYIIYKIISSILLICMFLGMGTMFLELKKSVDIISSEMKNLDKKIDIIIDNVESNKNILNLQSTNNTSEIKTEEITSNQNNNN